MEENRGDLFLGELAQLIAYTMNLRCQPGCQRLPFALLVLTWERFLRGIEHPRKRDRNDSSRPMQGRVPMFM